jgi:hypothetical protein
MSDNPASVPIDMCPHLLSGGLKQPLAFTTHPLQYLCVQCLADQVEDDLLAGAVPAILGHSIRVDRCEHGYGGTCNPCYESVSAALKLRRWQAYFSDHTHGNRLAKTIKEFRSTVSPVEDETEPVSGSGSVPTIAQRTATAKPKRVKRYIAGRAYWEDETEPLPNALCKPAFDVAVVRPGGDR